MINPTACAPREAQRGLGEGQVFREDDYTQEESGFEWATSTGMACGITERIRDREMCHV